MEKWRPLNYPFYVTYFHIQFFFPLFSNQQYIRRMYTHHYMAMYLHTQRRICSNSTRISDDGRKCKHSHTRMQTRLFVCERRYADMLNAENKSVSYTSSPTKSRKNIKIVYSTLCIRRGLQRSKLAFH